MTHIMRFFDPVSTLDGVDGTVAEALSKKSL